MIDVRCKNCNRLLAKADLMNAAIKCTTCKMIFEYKVYSDLTNLSSYDRVKSETTESTTL